MLAAQFIREKYWEYEYDEVVTPNMYNLDLWKTSGHADHYKACPCTADVADVLPGWSPSKSREHRPEPTRLLNFLVASDCVRKA